MLLPRPLRALRLALALVVAPAAAWGYEARIHEYLSGRFLWPSATDPAELLAPPDAAGMEGFRRELWQRLDEVPEASLHARWRELAPSPEHLTAARLEQLLLSNAERPLLGFEPLPSEPATAQAIVVRGARRPDVDRRSEELELYSALSAIAAGSQLPGAPYLARLFEGGAKHHAEDLCDPLHTLQPGLRAFDRDAQLEAWQQEMRTAGGLLGERVRPRDVAMRLAANHHLFLEDLFSQHFEEARAELDRALGETNEPLAALLAQPSEQPLERQLAAALVVLAGLALRSLVRRRRLVT